MFVILIAYDIKKYIETKKKEYITNIILTLGFAIWTLYPIYNSYFGWSEKQKEDMLIVCKDSNNTEVCNCIHDSIFKEFIYDEYKAQDKNSTEFKEFIKDRKEECQDEGWF